MNLQDHEFDSVVLGFDDKSKETVDALKKEGKRVLYISIDPQTMITMMAQKRIQSTQTNENITHLQVQQHQMQTSFQNTTTYLLQPIIQLYESAPKEDQVNEEVKEVVEMDLHSTEEDDKEEVMLQNEVDSENTIEEQLLTSSSTLEEREKTEEATEEHTDEEGSAQPTEDESEELPFPMVTPLAKECSLIDNRMLGIRRSKYPGFQRNEKNVGSNTMFSSYHLFNPIRIQEEEQPNKTEIEQETNLEDQTNKNIEETEEPSLQNPTFIHDKNNFIFHGPPSMNTASTLNNLQNEENEEPSSDAAQDKEKKLPNMDDLVLETPLEKSDAIETNAISEEKDEETTADSVGENEAKESSHTLVLNRDIRLRKKFSFHKLHQAPTPSATIDSTKKEETTTKQTNEEQLKKPDIFPLEPFSSRRRNKKSRLFSSLETAIPNPIVQPNTTGKSEKSFSSLIQESIIQQDSENNSIKTTESNLEDEVIPPEEEKKADSMETRSDNLKIDTIEFEEPYGYNSFEDFFPSFSNSNNRKRQELDKIEKRKIALRGLHNLINNLG